MRWRILIAAVTTLLLLCTYVTIIQSTYANCSFIWTASLLGLKYENFNAAILRTTILMLIFYAGNIWRWSNFLFHLISLWPVLNYVSLRPFNSVVFWISRDEEKDKFLINSWLLSHFSECSVCTSVGGAGFSLHSHTQLVYRPCMSFFDRQ